MLGDARFREPRDGVDDAELRGDCTDFDFGRVGGRRNGFDVGEESLVAFRETISLLRSGTVSPEKSCVLDPEDEKADGTSSAGAERVFLCPGE